MLGRLPENETLFPADRTLSHASCFGPTVSVRGLTTRLAAARRSESRKRLLMFTSQGAPHVVGGLPDSILLHQLAGPLPTECHRPRPSSATLPSGLVLYRHASSCFSCPAALADAYSHLT